jgi:hypothetical protein
MSTDPKLVELRLVFREKISAILDELEAKGFQPKISNAYRTEAQQLEKVAQGHAMKGATKPGSHNWGCACDIIDRRWGWNVTDDNAKFFAALCDLARAAGLVSGGAWFGKGGTRKKPTHTSPWNGHGLGWDVAHVELSNPPRDLREDYGPENR